MTVSRTPLCQRAHVQVKGLVPERRQPEATPLPGGRRVGGTWCEGPAQMSEEVAGTPADPPAVLTFAFPQGPQRVGGEGRGVGASAPKELKATVWGITDPINN